MTHSPRPTATTLSETDRIHALRSLADHPPPGRIVLCTVVGSRQYGYAREDSDLDLKSIHQVPTRSLLALPSEAESFPPIQCPDQGPLDRSTHELATALRLLLKGNGNLLECITSPLHIDRSPAAQSLILLAHGSLSRRYHAHYRGYLHSMQRAHARAGDTKTLLASIRLALTGTWLLRTGEVQCDLIDLAARFDLPDVLELTALHRKDSPDHAPPAALIGAVRNLWPSLEDALEKAHAESSLPPQASNAPEMSAWLVEQRITELARDPC